MPWFELSTTYRGHAWYVVEAASEAEARELYYSGELDEMGSERDDEELDYTTEIDD